jgi:hypothetical protein
MLQDGKERRNTMRKQTAKKQTKNLKQGKKLQATKPLKDSFQWGVGRG